MENEKLKLKIKSGHKYVKNFAARTYRINKIMKQPKIHQQSQKKKRKYFSYQQTTLNQK